MVRLLNRILPPGWHTEEEQLVRIPDFDEHEPDVAVVVGVLAHQVRPPGPVDLALLAEMDRSLLDRDKDDKQAAYDRAGIAFYWVVNRFYRQLEVWNDPPRWALS